MLKPSEAGYEILVYLRCYDGNCQVIPSNTNSPILPFNTATYLPPFADRLLPLRHIPSGQPDGARGALRRAPAAVGHAPGRAPAAPAAQAPRAGAPAAAGLDAHAAE